MTLNQKKYLLNVIRCYNFTYKATNNIGYKIVRDKLLNQLRTEIWGNNIVVIKAA